MNYLVRINPSPAIIRTGRAAGSYDDGEVWLLLDHARKALREEVKDQISNFRFACDAAVGTRDRHLPIEGDDGVTIPPSPSDAASAGSSQGEPPERPAKLGSTEPNSEGARQSNAAATASRLPSPNETSPASPAADDGEKLRIPAAFDRRVPRHDRST